jgi:hypothetical protein
MFVFGFGFGMLLIWLMKLKWVPSINHVGLWFWLVLDLVDLVKLKMGFLNQSCWPSLGLPYFGFGWFLSGTLNGFSILMLALGFTCHVLLKIHVQHQNAN